MRESSALNWAAIARSKSTSQRSQRSSRASSRLGTAATADTAATTGAGGGAGGNKSPHNSVTPERSLSRASFGLDPVVEEELLREEVLSFANAHPAEEEE